MIFVSKRLSSHGMGDLTNRPEELVYRSCFAPVDLDEMLQSADRRSAIRKLPPAQLYFSLKELDDDQVVKLLPHITEEQWATILDLDLWTKDELNTDRFLSWERHILSSEDAVARKLLRATDLEAWVLALKRGIQVFARGEDNEFDEEATTSAQYETPDGNYRIALPRNAEKARLYQQLLRRVYELDSKVAAGILESFRFQTATELEEEAYQNRRRRIEDLGFQDYYDAIEIYTCRDSLESLPKKKPQDLLELSTVPAKLPHRQEDGPLLLFHAFTAVSNERDVQLLVEELFYVCNKLLSADRISPDEPGQVKQGILKAISCLNLGLDNWAEGSVSKAVEGILNHYLLSFFQIGYGRLTELQIRAKSRSAESPPDPGSFLEAALDAMSEQFPKFTEQSEGRIRDRFFQTEKDLSWGAKLIDQLNPDCSAK